MFTGSGPVGAVGNVIGHIVCYVKETRSVVMTSFNQQTNAHEILLVKELTEPLLASVHSHLAGPHSTATVAIVNVKLTWQAGNVQAGYVLLKHNTATAVTNLINLSAAASSYLDLPVVNETYCYILAPVDIAGAPLGLSDLQCARPGFEIGTVAADNFTLALNQSSNATLTWLVPPDGVDTYTLWRITLDGAPPTSVTLPGSALDSVQPVAASGTCFQLLGEGGPGTGSTNILCGVPGVSSLNSSKLSVAALQTLMADALRNGGSIGQ